MNHCGVCFADGISFGASIGRAKTYSRFTIHGSLSPGYDHPETGVQLSLGGIDRRGRGYALTEAADSACRFRFARCAQQPQQRRVRRVLKPNRHLRFLPRCGAADGTRARRERLQHRALCAKIPAAVIEGQVNTVSFSRGCPGMQLVQHRILSRQPDRQGHGGQGQIRLPSAGGETGIGAVGCCLRRKFMIGQSRVGLPVPLLCRIGPQAVDEIVGAAGVDALPDLRFRVPAGPVPVDKIREVIGSGGKTIQKICADTGAKVDIDDDGNVFIAAVDSAAGYAAKKMIDDICFVPEVGALYYGKVVRILPIGACVEIAPGHDGMVHISKLENRRVEKVEDVLNVGDMTWVKFMGFDEKGRANFSRKDALKELAESEQ